MGGKALKKAHIKRLLSGLLVAALTVGLLGYTAPVTKTAKAATGADVVAIANAEIGYHEKETNAYLDDKYANAGDENWTKYARDVGYNQEATAGKNNLTRGWCGFFVWWCLMKAGLPKTAYAATGSPDYARRWYVNNGRWQARGSYIPKAGDVILFDHLSNGTRDGVADHIGLVEYVSGSYVYTIEGNTSNMVASRSYKLTDAGIMGYGIVNYDGTPVQVLDETENPGYPYSIPVGTFKKGSSGVAVKWIQTALNNIMNSGLVVDGDFGSLTETAVKNFQTIYAIDVDGVVGNQTIERLKEAWADIQKNGKATIIETEPEVTKYAVILSLPATNNGSQIIIDGIVTGESYAGDVTFTVACDEACVVAVKKDTDESFSVLEAVATDEENKYSFTVTVDVDMEIAIIKRGDISGDGTIDSADAMQILRADVGKADVSELEMIAGDITGDGIVNSADAMQILRFDVGKMTLEW